MNFAKRVLTLACASQVAFAFGGSLETKVSKLESELELLKAQMSNMDKGVERLRSKDLAFGGYFILEGQSIQGDDAKAASYRKAELELIVSGRLEDDIRFFSEFEFESEASLESKHTNDKNFKKHEDIIALERLWVEFQKSSTLKVQTGLIYTQIGVMNRVHFQPVILAADRALFLRNGLVTRRLAGFNIEGKMGGTTYHLYGGSDIELEDSPFSSGAYLTRSFKDNRYKLGLSYQNKYKDSVGYVDIVGADIKASTDTLELKIEYFADNNRGEGFYVQPAYTYDRYIFYWRHDFSDLDKDNSIEEDYKRNIYGLNYLVAGDRRIKFEYHDVDYVINKDSNGLEKDYNKLVAEIAFNF